jgi:ankyrin repeat protein
MNGAIIKPIDINIIDRYGNTALHEAMFQDNDKLSNNVPLEIDINDEDEDEDEEKVPLFTVTRVRVNY